MFYTYVDKEQWKPRLNIYDVFNGNNSASEYSNGYTETKTISTTDYMPMLSYMKYYENKPDKLIALANELLGQSPHYQLFTIPKRTGGMRQIAAPDSDTSENLIKIKKFFEKDLRIIPHNAAYAYVKGRCTKDALLKHTKHGSNFYLKIDLKDFFTSCNEDFIFNQLMKLQIIATMSKIYGEQLDVFLKLIIHYCMLNGGLPQGSPFSPTLTNLIMVPLDYYITNWCNKKGYCYTRYADDILISGKENFDYQQVINYLTKLFECHAPFTIKSEKTRYGSNKGRNWNLGLMVNQNNEITLGYRKKERLRATLFNFFTDLTNGNPWDIVDVQALQGTLSYYFKISPKMTNQTIAKYEQKFNKILFVEIQKIINP